jgi:pyruvate dehydrogenase E2 component (dihydrolipoamide acetyltransferase)
MEEARLIRWLVADGAPVEEGQRILEVETDKAIFTVEANAKGHLHLGPYTAGEVVPVLTVVATIGKADEKFVSGEWQIAKAQVQTDAMPSTSTTPIGTPPSSAKREGKVFVSPRARKIATAKGVDLAQVMPTGNRGQRVVERDVRVYLNQVRKATPVAQRMAAEAGVDLRQVTGTGVRGVITKEDVERAKAAKPVAASPVLLPEVEVLERVPLQGVRGIIAERMATSVHTTARVTLVMEVEATEFVAMRERLKARVEKEWGFAPGYNDLLAKIVATALRQFPYMNARLTPEGIERLAPINLGMAIDTERGLLVPVIRDADKKSLRQLGAEFRELIDRAHNAQLLPEDLTGGTFTLTNLGMYDILAFTPVINLPEAAILGVGCITPRPVVRDGQIVARQMLMLSLVFDHRVVDGAPAARFLQYIKNLIEEPYLCF